MQKDYSELIEKIRERNSTLATEEVIQRISKSEKALSILNKMEESGGEPCVVKVSPDGEVVIFDCFKETPKVRASLCYDEKALNDRKANKPRSSVEKEVENIGSELLNEDDYLFLQTLGDFDLKTSCWIKTPSEIREKGGAIFGDKMFGRTFIYHNGADSYYAVRGFRTKILV